MIRKRLTKALCLTLALTSILSATGCGKSGGKYTWIDSNLPENADKVGGIRLQDDFAAAANAKWLQSQTYDSVFENGTFNEATLTVDQNKRAMLNDTSVTDKNLELLRTFDGLYSDWDHRDELGAEPLRKYLERIDSISTLSDVEDYMLDNDGNPFAVMLINLGTIKMDEKKDHLCLIISQPGYSYGYSSMYGYDQSVTEPKKAVIKEKVSFVLTKLGYSDSEITGIVDSCVAFETQLAGIDPDGDLVTRPDKVVGKDEILPMTTAFDLNRVLDHYDLGDTVNYTGDFKYLEGLDSVFTSNNIEGMKAYFKVWLILNSMLLLDTEAFDYVQELELDKSNPYAEVDVSYKDRYLFRTIQKSALSGAMDQEYLDRYFDQKVYDDIYGILEDLSDGYREIIEEKKWLSDDSKASIYEKLDNMIFNVIRPSNEADYGDMKLASYEEGGTLIDAYCKLNKYKITHYGELTRMPYERGYWDIHDNRFSTTVTGDIYDSWNNAIYVDMGILYGDIYSYDMSYEEKLGAIGTVLGHEMSHAFDSAGVKYDKNGDFNDLLKGNDMDRFYKMSEKVTKYYENITPFEGGGSYTDENKLSGETIADMGGVSTTLRIAKRQAGFDYDKYFRAYASLWKRFVIKGNQYNAILTDSHPLAYLRVNVVVQQFDEFYETYDVKPGDNMYLAPGSRIAIW